MMSSIRWSFILAIWLPCNCVQQVENTVDETSEIRSQTTRLKPGSLLESSVVVSKNEIMAIRDLGRYQCRIEFQWERSDFAPDESADGVCVAVSFHPYYTQDHVVSVTKQLPELRCVSLRHCYRITDAALNSLALSDHLEIVDLSYTSSVYAGNNSVPPGFMPLRHRVDAKLTDSGLESLHRLTTLRVLNIAGNHFSEDSVLQLIAASKLRELTFSNGLLSTDSIKHLSASNPELILLAEPVY